MRALSLLAVLGCLAACASAPDSNNQAIGTHVPIMQLEGRDYVITVLSGDTPRFTVQTVQGELIARNATLDELAVTHPAVHERLRSALAEETELSVIDIQSPM